MNTRPYASIAITKQAYATVKEAAEQTDLTIVRLVDAVADVIIKDKGKLNKTLAEHFAARG